MIEIADVLEIEKYLDDVNAVIFDLDDTLYSEKEYVRSGYRQIAAYFGIPELEEQMWSVFQVGGMAIDVVLKAHNLIEKKEEALKIYRYQEPDIHLYDGVADMIARIRNTKKVGIITDGRPEGQKAKIKALELEKYFDEIIITDELGGINFRKPNPKAFNILAERFGVDYSQMCYIGDNIIKDFIAPQMLGMKCIWFRNPEGLYYGEKK